MKGYAAIASALVSCGVDTMFGLVGDANLLFVAEFVDREQGRFVGAVDERGATSMADGYSRVSGRLGVVSVTHGPAAANIVNPVVEAVRAHSPLLVLTGDTPARATEHPQRIDLAALFSATGAVVMKVRTADSLYDDIELAVTRAVQGRTAVVLNIPIDLVTADVASTSAGLCRTERQAVVPSEDALEAAVGILAQARRPVIVAGRGAVLSESRDALIGIAEQIGAPLATTGSGKDVFHGHRYDLGIMGGMSPDWVVDILAKADCVVAFGAGLNMFTTSNGDLLRDKAVIQVDDDPLAIGRQAAVTCGVVGDVTVVAERMLDYLGEIGAPSTGFAERFAQLASADRVPADDFAPRQSEGAMDARMAMIVAEECLPAEKVVVTDGGRFKVAPWRYLHVDDPRHFVQAGAWASIGLGISTAIGASVAVPGKRTVCVTGDGGGMMGLIELSTAARQGCNLTLIVLNDGLYGAEYSKFVAHGFSPRHAETRWPEFAAVGAALGAVSVTVRTEEELRSALSDLDGIEGPALIDVKTDPLIDPLGP